MAEVLSRRYAQWEKQPERSPYDAERDASFARAAEPRRHRRRQGPARRRAEPLQGFRDRGVAVVSLAKRIEEVFLPGHPEPVVLPHDTPELQLLQRVRDEAHRFAITHHRIRRDKAMTESIMDDLPGIGPARKRALLKHFGSPEACSAPRARSSRTSRASRRRSRATCTPTSTRRGAKPWRTRSATAIGNGARRSQPRGPRGHLRAERAPASRRP